MKAFRTFTLVCILIGGLTAGATAQNLVEKVDLKGGMIDAARSKQEKMLPARPGVPDLIGASTYAFAASAGIPLEDMSSGTTLLVAAGLDDNASAVTNIGFPFIYDGVALPNFLLTQMVFAGSAQRPSHRPLTMPVPRPGLPRRPTRRRSLRTTTILDRHQRKGSF